MSDVMSINTPMKPLGTTHKVQQGDWLITFEVVGWNEKCKCNTWAEKKRQFSPPPSYEWVLRSIEAEEQMRRTRALYQRLNKYSYGL